MRTKINSVANIRRSFYRKSATQLLLCRPLDFFKKLLRILTPYFATQYELNIDYSKIKVITRNLRHVTLNTYSDASSS